MRFTHRRGHARVEELRHVEGDIGVGVGIVAGQPLPPVHRALQRIVELGRRGACLDRDRIVGRRLQAHQPHDRREVDLIRLHLQQARAGARLGLGRPQRRRGLDGLEVLEDLGRIEDFQVAIHQHGHLALGVDARHLGVLGLVEGLHFERHHHKFEIDALLMQCNLGLGTEHAERTGVQFHVMTLTCACRLLPAI
jgi:hypothetical protein